MAPGPSYERILYEPENPFVSIVSGQQIAVIPEYTLESGNTIHNFPVAYKTWGILNDDENNVMVICHALTLSSDVADWHEFIVSYTLKTGCVCGDLIGPGKAFDTLRFLVVCVNSLGSPYGSASPCTVHADTGTIYGPEPLVAIRDDVRIHRLILDDVGVKQVAVALGGSMGGMLSTSARHSAWCISWGEAQRQCIYSDPKYEDGYYAFEDPPSSGLTAARMSALLTYRSRNSFESKFGRNVPDPTSHRTPENILEENWAVHNEGFKLGKKLASSKALTPDTETPPTLNHTSSWTSLNGTKRPQTFFTSQNYLRYQGEKFVKRFDANSYIAITGKLDTHDISRDREGDVRHALSTLMQPALVIGIESNGLFTFAEQEEIATYMPNARLAKIDSPEGHDAFLLEFAEVNRLVVDFLEEVLPDIMETAGAPVLNYEEEVETVRYSSTVGEVEDIVNW
ncbi:Alpha/Beta hydrolase protein [Lipomyces starkeyi]